MTRVVCTRRTCVVVLGAGTVTAVGTVKVLGVGAVTNWPELVTAGAGATPVTSRGRMTVVVPGAGAGALLIGVDCNPGVV